MLQDRKETIYSKGFDITSSYREIDTLNNSKIKVGLRKLDDAILELGSFKQCVPRNIYTDKKVLFKAILENDYATLQEFSKFFYKTSGIYAKLC